MTDADAPAPAADLYGELAPLCRAGLRRALNPETGTFNHQLRDRRWQATWGTEDLTSTAICLIGYYFLMKLAVQKLKPRYA